MVALLLAHGADKGAKTKQGETALDRARGKHLKPPLKDADYPAVVALLKK
jgi:hypothetical protein